MSFEMALPHPPRIQHVAADGTEQVAQDEQQWALYYTVQRALQQVGTCRQGQAAAGWDKRCCSLVQHRLRRQRAGTLTALCPQKQTHVGLLRGVALKLLLEFLSTFPSRLHRRRQERRQLAAAPPHRRAASPPPPRRCLTTRRKCWGS